MTLHITLCHTCAPNGQTLAEPLRRALADVACTVRETDCMSGCQRPATVAFRIPGKTAYLFGDVGTDDLADLANFARLYQTSPDGNFADARVLGGLRTKAIARIPA